MSVRRRSSRLQILNGDGVLRVWRDVAGHRNDAGEYVVVSNEGASKGEHLAVYLASGDSEPVPVRVVESRPVISDGSVKYELRLSPLQGERADRQNTPGDTGVEAK
jgi:hypothetical protein